MYIYSWIWRYLIEVIRISQYLINNTEAPYRKHLYKMFSEILTLKT